MAILSSTVLPVCLLVVGLAWWWQAYLVLAGYVLLFLAFERARRVGRAWLAPRVCGQKKVVLGGGWSWVLGDGAPPNYTLTERGPSASDGWWHAGTTIGEVTRRAARDGKTLAGHPSILTATLGGWVATQSHGTGGSLWTPTIGRLMVEEESGRLRMLSSKRLFQPGMIVREVELFFVDNAMCEQRVSYLTSEEQVKEVLFDTPTYLRAIFVDRHQAMSVTWTRPSSSSSRRSVVLPPFWLMTALPASWRRGLDTGRWTRRMTLRQANAFAPTPPFFLATPAMRLHLNFELFVTEPTTPSLIWRLSTRLREVFRDACGRVEIRFGAGKQFLDFDLLRVQATPSLLHRIGELVREVYGRNVKVELHPGKANVRDLLFRAKKKSDTGEPNS